jgi:hypothetical protein
MEVSSARSSRNSDARLDTCDEYTDPIHTGAVSLTLLPAIHTGAARMTTSSISLLVRSVRSADVSLMLVPPQRPGRDDPDTLDQE